MSKRQFYMILGVWIIVFPFMGFPASWDKVISILTGLLLIILAYTSGYDDAHDYAEDAGATFVEHKAATGRAHSHRTDTTSSKDVRSAEPVSTHSDSGDAITRDTSSSS